MARFRRRRRARKRYLWTGIQASDLIFDEVSLTVFELIGPFSVDTLSDMLVERVVFDLTLTRGVDFYQPISVGCYLTVVPTDLGGATTEDPLWHPLSGDIDAMQKRPMWYRRFELPMAPAPTGEEDPLNGFSQISTGGPAWSVWGQTNSGPPLVTVGGCLNGGLPFDVNVKRKLGGDNALVLVFGHNCTTGNEVSATVMARALVSVGRK